MDVTEVPDFASMTIEERCMRVPHLCLLGCTIAPSDHWPRKDFFVETQENLRQLRKTITLHQHRSDPEFLKGIIEEFLQGRSAGIFNITLETGIL